MANFIRRGTNEQRDPNAAFGISKEIAYLVSKHNICPVAFKKTFDSCGSVSKAIQICLAAVSVGSTIS